MNNNNQKYKTIGEVAFACYLPGQRDEMKSPIPEGDEPGLIESSFFDPANFSFPAGSHICEVEIDPDTGNVKVEFEAIYTKFKDAQKN